MTLALWWRDDDAAGDHPALTHLLALAGRHRLPLALAVIPARLERACARRLLASPLTRILQHGIAHRNHARPGQRRIELGGTLSARQAAAGLTAGFRQLEKIFGARFLPVQVPPWNRIDPVIEGQLPALGFAFVSTEWRRQGPAVPGLRRIDIHIDALARDTGRVKPLRQLAAELAALAARGVRGPVGLMTHHRVMEGDDFARLDAFLRWSRERVRWIDPLELFARP